MPKFPYHAWNMTKHLAAKSFPIVCCCFGLKLEMRGQSLSCSIAAAHQRCSQRVLVGPFPIIGEPRIMEHHLGATSPSSFGAIK